MRGGEIKQARHDTARKLSKRREQMDGKRISRLNSQSRCLNDCDNNENTKEKSRQEVRVYQPAQVSCRLSELVREFRRNGLEYRFPPVKPSSD